MRRNVLLVLLLVIALVGVGCDAPLEPESRKRAESTPTATPSTPSTPSTPAAPSTSPSGGAAPQGTPAPQQPPSIEAPEVPRVTEVPRDPGPILGADISWPQCPKGMGIPKKRGQGSPMPLPEARYVIIGLTNGPAFYPNPCLASQTEWVKSRGLMAAAYSVLSYPEKRHFEAYKDKGPYDGSTRLGALSNVGYQQAKFNLATMRAAGLESPIVWLDVEPVPEFDWPKDPTANSAVVRGAARGYTDSGFKIGTYSTQSLWSGVVGDLELGIPEWRAAGQTSGAEALERCKPDRMFQGGKPVLSQWVEDERDQNYTCPGISNQMGRWFHQY